MIDEFSERAQELENYHDELMESREQEIRDLKKELEKQNLDLAELRQDLRDITSDRDALSALHEDLRQQNERQRWEGERALKEQLADTDRIAAAVEKAIAERHAQESIRQGVWRVDKARAVEAEREACARLAELHTLASTTGPKIAAAIRSRRAPEPQHDTEACPGTICKGECMGVEPEPPLTGGKRDDMFERGEATSMPATAEDLDEFGLPADEWSPRKLKRDRSTPENQEFWDGIEAAAKTAPKLKVKNVKEAEDLVGLIRKFIRDGKPLYEALKSLSERTGDSE